MRAVFDGVMRIVSSVIGLLMVASGTIWFLQGTGWGPEAIMRSFMAGDPKWAVYGVIMAAFGVAQVVWSNTRR